MFRFTIRELLILTLTAGLAVGWWEDHRVERERYRELKAKHDPLAQFVGDTFEYAVLTHHGWAYKER
jgi:hypothetical protein